MGAPESENCSKDDQVPLHSWPCCLRGCQVLRGLWVLRGKPSWTSISSRLKYFLFHSMTLCAAQEMKEEGDDEGLCFSGLEVALGCTVRGKQPVVAILISPPPRLALSSATSWAWPWWPAWETTLRRQLGRWTGGGARVRARRVRASGARARARARVREMTVPLSKTSRPSSRRRWKVEM